MTLQEWIDEQSRVGSKSVRHLHFATRLSTNTIRTAIKGKRVNYDTAKKLHDATDGKVSIESMCNPRGEQ